MGLSIDQIKREITEPRKRGTISRAIIQQNRIKFHAQTYATPIITQPVTDFLAMVRNRLPHDKFKIFENLFRYPLRTNEVTSICFDKLSRIFDGRNPAFNYHSLTVNNGMIGNITVKTYCMSRKCGARRDGSFSRRK